MFLAAFGAPKPLYNVIELGIPPGNVCESTRKTAADMSALTGKIDEVLAELIAQLFDLEIPHRGYCTSIQSRAKVGSWRPLDWNEMKKKTSKTPASQKVSKAAVRAMHKRRAGGFYAGAFPFRIFTT